VKISGRVSEFEQIAEFKGGLYASALAKARMVEISLQDYFQTMEKPPKGAHFLVEEREGNLSHDADPMFLYVVVKRQ
jgi:hypothetical protein